jgi:hypothetical protein
MQILGHDQLTPHIDALPARCARWSPISPGLLSSAGDPALHLAGRSHRPHRIIPGHLAAVTARRAEEVVMHDRDRCRQEAVRTTQDPIKDLAENGPKNSRPPITRTEGGQ